MSTDTQLDYYEILQVSPNADAKTIQAAYRRLARKYHPDRGHFDAERMMRLLNEAYGVLSDPDKRQEYDAERERGEAEVRARREERERAERQRREAEERVRRQERERAERQRREAEERVRREAEENHRRQQERDAAEVHSDMVQCPHCYVTLQYPRELAGLAVKCPCCGVIFTAGDSAAQSAPGTMPKRAKHGKKKRKEEEKKRKEEEKKRKEEEKQKQDADTVFVVLMVIGGIVLAPVVLPIVAGVVAAVVAVAAALLPVFGPIIFVVWLVSLLNKK